MNAMRSLIVLILGLFSAIYLVNPTAGFIELIPDNFPVIGNLDEAAATILLINCLAYFGLDLRHLLQRKPKEPADAQPTMTGKFTSP
jgi:uncharacterized membrane protein YkvA (DUF1232 family)